MTKKMIKHIEEICSDPKSFTWNDDKYFYIANTHRILRLNEKPDVSISAPDPKLIKLINDFLNFEKHNYERTIIPSLAEIKQGIAEIVGKKRDIVTWGCSNFVINARYMVKAMEILNSNVGYAPIDFHGPIIFF